MNLKTQSDTTEKGNVKNCWCRSRLGIFIHTMALAFVMASLLYAVLTIAALERQIQKDLNQLKSLLAEEESKENQKSIWSETQSKTKSKREISVDFVTSNWSNSFDPVYLQFAQNNLPQTEAKTEKLKNSSSTVEKHFLNVTPSFSKPTTFTNSTVASDLKDSTESKSLSEFKKEERELCEIVSIHYSGDTSNYSTKHHFYSGNGRIASQSEIYKDWKVSHWTEGREPSRYFRIDGQGRVTVEKGGIYLVYAQIEYSNNKTVNGFRLYRNSDAVARCIDTSLHSLHLTTKVHTCSLSTTILLSSKDLLYIKDLHHKARVVLAPENSYFGLVLLSKVN